MYAKIHLNKVRNLENTEIKQLIRDLLNAPWQVADIFNNIDDKYDYWSGLFESVVDTHAHEA